MNKKASMDGDVCPHGDGELTEADLEHVVGGLSREWAAVSDEEGWTYEF